MKVGLQRRTKYVHDKNISNMFGNGSTVELTIGSRILFVSLPCTVLPRTATKTHWLIIISGKLQWNNFLKNFIDKHVNDYKNCSN